MRRSRSPASSNCTASRRDSSDWDVSAFKASRRLRSGTPCWDLRSPQRKSEAFLLVTAYLHRSHLRHGLPQTKDGFSARVGDQPEIDATLIITAPDRSLPLTRFGSTCRVRRGRGTHIPSVARHLPDYC